MLPAYQKAFLLEPPTVLGRQLKPFCLGHSYLMECLDSPYVTGVGDITDASLVLGVWVCSRTFEDACLAIRSGDVEKDVERWSKRNMRAKWQAEHDAFAGYVIASKDAPPRWQDSPVDDGGGPKVRVPWQFLAVWGLVGGVMSEESESHAWNMPMARVMCYAAARAYNNGDDSFMTEDEVPDDDLIVLEGGIDATS